MSNLNRRTFVGAGLSLPFTPKLAAALQSTPAAPDPVDHLVIDLPAEPVNINPAMAYSDLEWTIVHSIFDSLVGFDANGDLRPVAAETFERIDDVTWEVKLKPEMTFHDGSPVTSAAIIRGFDLVNGSDSLVSDIFGIVESMYLMDQLTVQIKVSEPSPSFPAQMASWHVLIPEGFNPDQPIGSGPYRFEEWVVGEEISLMQFENYQPSATKGVPIADSVTYHFVPEDTTRVSNSISGASDIASFLPVDALSAFQGENTQLRHAEVAGTWFIRIADDTPPFDDVRVRQALNLALDLESFIGVLVHDGCQRLASLYPGPVALGFDPELSPYAYDPDAARALLEEAGYADGISVQLEAASDASVVVCEAIISQWASVGINAELVLSDLGAFNANWADPDAPALRMASWSPMFDPDTLLDLVWKSDGVLSRTNNPEIDELIARGDSTFGEEREEAYRELGHLMHEEASAVYLWNLMHVAAVSEKAAAWTPRPDQWILALSR